MLEIFKYEDTPPNELILALKSFPDFALAYQTRVRHYILERHTELVLSQFDKYFNDIDLPIPRNLFRFLLAIHDIGKPQAHQERNLERQYFHTMNLINKIRSNIPFSPKEIDFCLTIINGDPMGQYMQDRTDLSATRTAILAMVGNATVSLSVLFKTLTLYYQCDTAAYTADAGGIKFLEKLFVYKDGHKTMNSAKGILSFSPIFELKYNKLENAFV